MVEQERLKNDFFDRLPIGDVPYLRILVQRYRDNPKMTTESFFSFALLGFYDAMWDGLNGMAGHIIYRLSDAIEKPQRETMVIYPSSKGSIINVNEEDVGEHELVNRWASLEDWRKEWEHINPVIPDYAKQLPSAFSLKKTKDTP